LNRTSIVILVLTILSLLAAPGCSANTPLPSQIQQDALSPEPTVDEVAEVEATPTQQVPIVQETATPLDPTFTVEMPLTMEQAPASTDTPVVMESFDGQRAFADVERQIAFGPRIPGSQAHAEAVDWMVEELTAAGWEVEVQETERMGHPIRNVIARYGEGDPWVVLGAHYDSRMQADQDTDPQKRTDPVPGANDGASGVAVLLELARTLPPHLNEDSRAQEVWLVLFDAEDNGNLPGWDWILGSQAFVDSLDEEPDMAVIIDMIGDADLNIYREMNSDPVITDQIWETAQELEYEEQFINQPKFSMLDDHTPFLRRGIPAIDIIDFDYPYWHTTEDTPDKVSAESLKAVGDTLVAWLREPLSEHVTETETAPSATP
jgi:hypothetical protein